METVSGEDIMAIYEIVQDVYVKNDDNTLKFYHGRRPGHKGQFIDEHNINPEHLESIRGRSDLEFVRKTGDDKPDQSDVNLDRFGKEIYFCEKCKKNHRKESKIGIAHDSNVL